MPYSSELKFAEKLLRSYFVPFRFCKHPMEEGFEPDFGLRKMIDPSFDYNRFFFKDLDKFSDNVIYRVRDAFECRYIFFLLPNREAIEFALLGPYCAADISADDISDIANIHGLPAIKAKELEKFYSKLTLIEDDRYILNVICTLGECMWGEIDSFTIQDADDFVTDDHIFNSAGVNNDSQEALISMKFIEERYAGEQRLIKAVASGQAHKAEMMISNIPVVKVERRSSDPLRDMKNYTVILNTLLRKAVESASVHPIHIDSLSSQYAKRIEAASSMSSLNKIQREMVKKYCQLVNNHSMKGYSALVRKIITRIDYDLTADLSLHTQAELLNVNSSYLSTLFKKETGVTLTEYVNKKRVEHAAYLLVNTNSQVQIIAQQCGIADVNYFTKTFKRYMGKTPKEYRDSLSDLHVVPKAYHLV